MQTIIQEQKSGHRQQQHMKRNMNAVVMCRYQKNIITGKTVRVNHVVMYAYTAAKKQHEQKVRYAKPAARSIQIKIWQITEER